MVDFLMPNSWCERLMRVMLVMMQMKLEMREDYDVDGEMRGSVRLSMMSVNIHSAVN